MEFMEGRALSRHLLERYSRNPNSWSFTIAPSARDSFFDAVFSNPEEAWQIKIDSIFKPTPRMLGAKVEVDFSKFNSLSMIPYGYRKVDPSIVLRILAEANETPEKPSGLNLDTILGPLDTVAPKQGESYAEGPFVFTNQKIANFSQNQKHLDERLSSELRRLLRDTYLGYG